MVKKIDVEEWIKKQVPEVQKMYKENPMKLRAVILYEIKRRKRLGIK